MKRIAVIDIGTNTFHLLIFEPGGRLPFKPLYSDKKIVKLGTEGLKIIGNDPFRRGVEALKEFKKGVKEYETEQEVVFATAGLRMAENAEEFINRVKKETGFIIRVISGDQEAKLIYKGVKGAVRLTEQPVLIMDIGGGSIEFVIGTHKEILWKRSLNIGASLLREKFHRNEPISKKEQEGLKEYIQENIDVVYKAIDELNPVQFIGCSGSFETLADILIHQSHGKEKASKLLNYDISASDFRQLFPHLISSTHEERLRMEGMEPLRADMMVVAAITINEIMKKIKTEKIIYSAYAMKEGILVSLQEGKDPLAENF